jgi:amino-acid N-acetyltransferase
VNIFSQPPETAVKRLLTESQLAVSDLTLEHLEHFFGCGWAQKLDGVVGLEIYGSVALLRSLAVTPQRRGRGCGKALVAEAERYAQSRGIHELYLLTTTADRFFEGLGYERVSRETAPESIRRTREFSDLCPSTSTFMVKHLPANPSLNLDAQKPKPRAR